MNEENNKNYEFKNSGIKEQEGVVPIWLYVVYGLFFIWGIIYLIKNWSLPQ